MVMGKQVFVAIMLCMAGITCGRAHASVFDEARARRRAFTDTFMETVLTDPKMPVDKGKVDAHAPVYAIAALYTGKHVAGGNQRLKDAWHRLAGKDGKMTPEEAAQAKWHMRGMLRAYYLFYDKSDRFPGRLTPQVQALMESLFFHYGSYKSSVKRAQREKIWYIQGSENHDMMDLSNAYLSLQAVQDLPTYKDRQLPDGHTAAQHVKAWEAYYARYCLERAKNGLFVEISPTYGKWFVGELVNMADFAAAPLVKTRMTMLLHLVWTDWAIDQLNGVRGGGKTRCYQGRYSQRGERDSWDRMACALFGIKNWVWNSHGGLSTMALLTSRYELPDVTLDIALNKGEFDPFVYPSTRPAKQLKSPRGLYVMDPEGGGMLRYSYCTPESVMGSWMLDTRTPYAAINTQNRWQGVVFATGPDARVFPQSVGLGNRKTYNQHVAVQHRNVMIVAPHPKAKQAGQMRVYVPGEWRERLIERKGWVIVKEEEGWLGVRVLDGRVATGEKNYEFRGPDASKETMRETSRHDSDCIWLWPTADKPPVVFVTSRVGTHKTLSEFLGYLSRHAYDLVKGRVTYQFFDDLGDKIRLELGGTLPVPRVNGQAVNLYPTKVFDSPYMRAEHGSGVVKIVKGDRTLVLEFNK